MALTNWNDILNKPAGIEEAASLAEDVQEISEDVGEIALDVSELSASVLSIAGEVEQIQEDIQEHFVSVTADGVKTIKTLLNDLFTLINFNKVNSKSTAILGNNTMFSIERLKNDDYCFYDANVAGSTPVIRTMRLNAASSEYKYIDLAKSQIVDQSSVVLENGTILKIVY